MTRRAWVILAVGVLLSAALGCFVLVDRGRASAFKPSASAGAFTNAAWDTVKQRAADRGFSAESIRVVTAAGGSPRRNALALLAATRASGEQCFILARGSTLGASICRLARPVNIFTARDHFSEIGPGGRTRSVPATAVLGLVRRDISSVVLSWKTLGRRTVEGMPLLDVPGGRAFAVDFRGTSGALTAHDVHGTPVYRLDLPQR